MMRSNSTRTVLALSALAALVFISGAPVEAQVLEVKGGEVCVGCAGGAIGTKMKVTASDGSAKVLVEETSASAAPRRLFEIQNNGTTQFRIKNTQITQTFDFKVDPSGFVINRPGVAASNFTISPTGVLTMGAGGSTMSLQTNGDMTIAGTLTQNSDRSAKENFEAVDAQAVLEKVASLPISTWNYRDNEDSVRHMGPMAQDFRQEFGLGATDKGISVIDTDGVALAAIQGLYQQLQDREAKLRGLEQTNSELAGVLAELGREVEALRSELPSR
ncbi:MAG: tail fiber domain-containing protein [Thermoanaerobaculia bacterium]